jgi:hypothetical protein
MARVLQLCLLVLAFAASAAAQALPVAKEPAMRWLVDFELGTKVGLGFKLPHTAFRLSYEQPIGARVELQGSVFLSPDKSNTTNDGESVGADLGVLLWETHRLAITGSVTASYLWTSQVRRGTTSPAFGVVIRDNFGNLPGRLYLTYMVPTGCEWGVRCSVQSERLQGPQGYWEHRLYPQIRLGVHFGVYHRLYQSNPLLPNIPRSGQWTGDSYVVIRFEVPPRSLDGDE